MHNMTSSLFPPFWRQRLIRRRSKESDLESAESAVARNNASGTDIGRGSVKKSCEAITWGLLWNLAAEQQKLRLFASVFSLLTSTICSLWQPIYSGKLLLLLTGDKSKPLWKLLYELGILYILEPLFTIIFVVNTCIIWENVMSNLKLQMFQMVLTQKVEFFDCYKVGELTALLTTDLGSLQRIVSDNFSKDRGFRALSEVIGTVCILFSLSPQLAPILVLLMLTVSLLVAVYKQSTVPIFKAHGLALASIAHIATETFSAIRTVRSFVGEKRQMSIFRKQVFFCQTSGIKLGLSKSINESLTRIAVHISLMSIYSLGVFKARSAQLSVGTIMTFIGYTIPLIFSVQGLVNTFVDLRGAFAAVERINLVLCRAVTVEAIAYAVERDIRETGLHVRKSAKICGLAWHGDVCFEDVHFSYPLRPDMKVLDGLNLTLRAGIVTALVGPSGAGKSTTVQLLARFYEPNRGRITVAGEDIDTINKNEWAWLVSIVNQDPVLFSVSVKENIAYGLPDDHVSMEDVMKAAEAASAHDFIVSLPQGYDTLVGERGCLLSGGERQRIAIARALLKNSPILILDEATNALDSLNEHLVRNTLNCLMKGRTTLVIAHRLNTIQNANQIAFISGGKIAEVGTHVELLERKGEYSSMLRTQGLVFESY